MEKSFRDAYSMDFPPRDHKKAELGDIVFHEKSGSLVEVTELDEKTVYVTITKLEGGKRMLGSSPSLIPLTNMDWDIPQFVLASEEIYQKVVIFLLRKIKERGGEDSYNSSLTNAISANYGGNHAAHLNELLNQTPGSREFSLTRLRWWLYNSLERKDV